MGSEPAEKVADLAAALREQSDALALEHGARAARSHPEWVTERPELAHESFRLSRAGFEAGLGALAGGARIPSDCPVSDAEVARITAQQGVPVHILLDTYRLAHSVAWDGWMDVVERREPDPHARARLLRTGSEFFFAYFGRITALVVELHRREREAILRSGERRVHLVREILEGRDTDLASVGYEIAHHHVGLVAWGPRTREAAEALARELGRRLLLVEVFEDTTWAWLGGGRPLDAGARRRLRAFRPPDGAHLAVGVDAPGREGFRRTHADARDAQRAAWPTRAPVTFFDDVALEALAARDETAARRFVARELRGIDGEDARARRLRETLVAYFRHAGNAAATAKALGIHEQTVAQRLDAVEERTGRPVVARRAELETALRLRSYLAPPALGA